jgi:Flp pilus assembly protein TadD
MITTEPSRSTNAYRNRGLARYVTGALAEAIPDLSQAIALNPREAESYAVRGLAKLEQGRQAEAESDFAQSRVLGHADHYLYFSASHLMSGHI